MNSVIKNTFIFAAGAAIGSVATLVLVKTKYEQIIQEETDALRELYSGATPSEPVETEPVEKIVKVVEEEPDKPAVSAHKPDFTGYAKKLSEYTTYSDKFGKGEPVTVQIDKPYVIAPEEFGDLDDYERISLTYYSDKVLTDEDDEVIDDVDHVVGSESLTTFGKYEDDSVYVRNDSLKCDYEILLDERKYSDVKNAKRHRPEVE